MKSMKGLSMNRMLGSIKKRTGNGSETPPAPTPESTAGQSPETIASNSVKAFCESGGGVKGDEVLFLPAIVESAESSPTAAAECARVIRKFLAKEYFSRPTWQYNAIMLVRILSDNPGDTFTRNFDQKFVDTVQVLLKSGKDRSVRHILMETLDDFEQTKGLADQNLALMVSMWQQEKGKALKNHGGPPFQRNHSQPLGFSNHNSHSQNYFARSHSSSRIPDAIELASRLEEARTSAKLLEQVVMNTPPADTLDNDLIKEFADRCLSASRSIQGYMGAQNPSLDNDTMESLIDTNEQLQTALSQHQRAVLNARKQLGLNIRSEDTTPTHDPVTPPPNGLLRREDTEGADFDPAGGSGSGSGSGEGGLLPESSSKGKGKGKDKGKGKEYESYDAPLGPPPGVTEDAALNPFDDPVGDPEAAHARGPGPSSSGNHGSEQLHVHEPFHPGGFSSHASGGDVSDDDEAALRHTAADLQLSPPRAPVGQDDDLYEATPRTHEPAYRY